MKPYFLILSSVFLCIAQFLGAEMILNQPDEIFQGKIRAKDFHGQKAFFFIADENKYVSGSTAQDLGKNFTVSAWFEPNGIPVRLEKFGIIGHPEGKLFLGYAKNQRFSFRIALENGDFCATWTRPVVSERWYHLVAVCDNEAKKLTFYLNGKMAHTTKLPASPAAFGREFIFGCGNPTAKTPFWCNGLVSDVRLYNERISAEKIRNLFEEGKAKFPFKPLLPEDYVLEKPVSFQLLPPMTESVLTEAQKADAQKNLPGQLQGMKALLAQIKGEVESAFKGIRCIQQERVEKRMEIADNLLAFAERNFHTDTVPGLVYCKMALYDLKYITDYFKEELEAWKQFPKANDPAVIVLKGEDFGLKGDGIFDNGTAFAKALEALRKRNGVPTILRIPAGNFYVKDFPEARVNLPIAELKNAIIEGESPETTHLIFGKVLAGGVSTIKCSNLAIRNLSLRYAETPFFQGEILSVDSSKNQLIVRHKGGTMRLEDPRYKKASHGFQCATTYKTDGTLFRSQFMSYKHKFEQVDGETYQITMDSSVQWLQAGLHLVIPCREGRAPVFADSESNLVTLDNVHVRNSYAAAFQSWGGRLLTLTNCKATPMPGLYLSSNADFCIGGAYLSHCYSDAPGDDCFNTHIPGMIISSIDDNKVYHPRYKTPVVGDYATIYNTTTGQLCGIGESANNSSWIQDKPGSTLKESLPQGIATRKNGIRKDDFLGNSVWKGLIRYTDTVSRIFYPHHKFSIPVVFDCTFRNTRSGIVIMSPAGLVEGNTFENLPMGTGIIVGSIIGVGEGPVPYSVTVRNNIVRNAWTGLKSHVLCQPSIQPGPTVAIQGILFENNQIFDTVNPLWFNNLGKSEIKNVSITGKSEYADRFKEQSNKLRIARSDSVQLSGITLQGKPVTGQNFETAHALNIKIQ